MPIDESGREEIIVNGVFRSGTNLLKHLFQENSDLTVRFNKYWWKHLPPPYTAATREALAQARFFIAIRNPVSWSNSIYNFFLQKRSELYPASLLYSDFIDLKAVIFDSSRGNMASPRYVYRNIFEYYNNFYLTWLSLESELNVQFVNIDQLKQEPGIFARLVPETRMANRSILLPEMPVLPSSDERRTELGKSLSDNKSPDFVAFDKSVVVSKVAPEIIQRFSYHLDQSI